LKEPAPCFASGREGGREGGREAVIERDRERGRKHKFGEHRDRQLIFEVEWVLVHYHSKQDNLRCRDRDGDSSRETHTQPHVHSHKHTFIKVVRASTKI